jgi:hypothetical protein
VRAAGLEPLHLQVRGRFEQVTTVLVGTEIPGLRITARMGRPKFAVAITQAQAPASPTEQVAVRDEIFELLAG